MAWFRRQWLAFVRSYDDDEVAAGSAPGGIAVAAGSLIVVYAVLGYVPAVAVHSVFSRPWLPMILAGAGGLLTLNVWRCRARGWIAQLSTLFDNAFYSGSLALAACATSPGFGIGFAVVYAVHLIAFPGSFYGFSLPFAAAMALPLAVTLPLAFPGATIALVLVGGYVMMLVTSQFTGRRRQLLEEKRNLTRAVGAASQVADESVQAALSSTLLTLGHFLHELRNHQTVVRANLSFLELTAGLDATTVSALEDAIEAQEAEERLVAETLDMLKGRARQDDASFDLGAVIQSAVGSSGLDITLTPPEQPFVVHGVSEHLEGVLGNLLRNAAQAGAKKVDVLARLEPSGHAIMVRVGDDGPGIPAEHWKKLFDPFAYTTKASGTGLGLYLCRRYVELMGGSIEVGQSTLGGAAFTIRLPGSVVGNDDDEPRLTPVETEVEQIWPSRHVIESVGVPRKENLNEGHRHSTESPK
ncbi:MAG: HAMP domain-containing sensor histidine kinase [Myxococcota bacterium]